MKNARSHLAGPLVVVNLFVTAFFGCSILVDNNIQPDPSIDGGAECTGVENGTACPGAGDSGLICLNGLCVESVCGDGFIDEARGEECEPSTGGVGCDAVTCTWRCNADADCDDGNLCNGAETCTLATHTCSVSPRPSPGTSCPLDAEDDPPSGQCLDGLCVESAP